MSILQKQRNRNFFTFASRRNTQTDPVMSLLRFKMVDAAINHTAVEVKAPEGRPSDYFGEKVFGREAMRKYLDKKTYAALLDTMEHRTPLTREVADSIAAGMLSLIHI